MASAACAWGERGPLARREETSGGGGEKKKKEKRVKMRGTAIGRG